MSPTSHCSGAFCTCRGDGLGEPQGAGLAPVQHARGELLRRGPCKRRSRALVLPRSSTATRGVNSPAATSPTGSRWPAFASRWTVRPLDGQRVYRAPVAIRSSPSAFTCPSSPLALRPGPASAGGWTSTTGARPHSSLNGRTPEEAYTRGEADRAWGSAPPPASQTQLES